MAVTVETMTLFTTPGTSATAQKAVPCSDILSHRIPIASKQNEVAEITSNPWQYQLSISFPRA